MNLPLHNGFGKQITKSTHNASRSFYKALRLLKNAKKMSLFLVMLCALMGFTTLPTSDCDIAHEGTFIYFYNQKEVKVIIHKDLHTEYHEGGKYIIQSHIHWIDDCSFIASCIKNTFPNPAYTVEDQMYVKINQVIDNEIYFTSIINRFEWSGKMVKVK